MKEKQANKLWNELFSPPCPKCGGTRTKEELRDRPVVATMKEFFDRSIAIDKGEPLPPIRTWECYDCGTVYDEKGRCITYEGEPKRGTPRLK